MKPKSSKTLSEHQKFKVGSISQAINLAFGNHARSILSAETPSQPKFKRLGELKGRSSGLFLTEAEVAEYEELKKTEQNPQIPSFEEMIQELDTMSYGFKGKFDDLAELRRKIARCKVGIEEREVSYAGLQRSANEIHSQSKAMMEKVKSLSNLKK